MYSEKIQHILSVMVTIPVLLVCLPFFIVIALLIKADSKGSVLFIQERIGKNGKKFKLLKFRSMLNDAHDTGIEDASEKDPRITKVGKFIREWTIDEFPQLLNIISGDMNLIGPRPMPEYEGNNKKIRKLWEERKKIRPGLISMVDIKGRNLVPWEKRFEYDAWYIKNKSFFLDLKILFFAVFAVLSRKGVYGENEKNILPK